MGDVERRDTAHALSFHIVELFAGCLREECLPDAREAVFEKVLAALEVYDSYKQSVCFHRPSSN
jgi:hypothetical protein